jgi:hypothetical protein
MNLKTQTLLALLVGVALTGCAPNRGSLEAVAVCAMTNDCTFSAKCDAVHLGDVQYNSAGGTQWLQFPVEIQNQIPDNASEELFRSNTNDAHVTGYILEYDGVGPGSMTLDVGHHTIPAAGSSIVWVYAAGPGAPLGNYTVNIKFFGYYDNGREFETPPFPVALKVDNSFAGGCGGTTVLSCPYSGLASQQSIYACK